MSCRTPVIAFTLLSLSLLLVWQPSPAIVHDDPKPAGRVDTQGRPLPEGAIARLGGGGHKFDAFPFSPRITVPPIGERFYVATSKAIEEWDCTKLQKIKQVPVTGRSDFQISAVNIAKSGKIGVVATHKNVSLLGALFGGSQSIKNEVLLLDMRGDEWKITPLTTQPDLIDVAITPDGEEVVGSTLSKGLFIWGAAERQLRRQIPVEGKTTGQVALSPDGQTLLVARHATDPKKKDAAVLVIDYASGRLEMTIADLDFAFPRVLFSPNGKSFAISGHNHVTIHDRTSGSIKRLPIENVQESNEWAGAHLLTMSPDGRKLAAMVGGVGVHVWSIDDDKPATTYPLGNSFAHALFFLPNGTLMVGLGDTFVAADALTGKYLSLGAACMTEVLDVAFSRLDHRIWTIDRTSLCRWNSHSFAAEQFATHGSSLQIICEANNTLIDRSLFDSKLAYSVIDVGTGKRRKMPIPGSHYDAELSPDGQVLLYRGKDGEELTAFSMETGKQLITVPCDLLVDPIFAPDSKSIIVNTERDLVDCSVRTYDIASQQCIHEWHWKEAGRDWGVRTDAMAISLDGRRVYAAQDFRSKLRIVERANGETAAEYDLDKGIGLRPRMLVSPDGRWIAVPTSVKEDKYFKKVEIFNALTGKSVTTWKTEAQFRLRLAFSPDSSMLVTSGNAALVWDVAPLRTLPANPRLDEATRNQLWADLEGDAPTAFQAIRQWIDSPDAAIAHLRTVLVPIPRGPVPKDVEQFLSQLDSDKFDEREEAVRQLKQMGFAAEAALHRFLAANPSVEAKRRAERILAALGGSQRRTDRALEILELIGTPAARVLLAKLADGEPGARLTIDAKAGVERIDRRKW